ncbi:type IV secretory system conjugative DNA transfer family protein [Candidatus Gracilibacteria bacterium]|nr:type IV secretory system conjugative DNA transfer family protein [Candidatus Gracilibacteria bacterium]
MSHGHGHHHNPDITLIIRIPSDFSGGPKEVAEMLEALHPTLGHSVFSMDFHIIGRKLFFSLQVSHDEKSIIENQLYTTFQDIEIEEVKSPMKFDPANSVKASIGMREHDFFPIQTYLDGGDSVLKKILSQTSDLDLMDKCTFQIALMPAHTHNTIWNFSRKIKHKWHMVKNSVNVKRRYLDTKVNIRSHDAEHKYEHKNHANLYYSKLTCYIQSSSQALARAKMLALLKNLYDLENHENQIIFDVKPMHEGDAKNILAPVLGKRKYLLTSEEIATLWHFPQLKDKVPHILRILSRKARPPLGLPTSENTSAKELVKFGITNYRSQKIPFGLKSADKARHLYMVGKSGSGKSKLLELLAYSDIINGRGFALLDPHGDLVDNILKYIPEERKKDIVLFDPTDLNFPVGFNPLEEVPEEYRQEFTNSFLEIFKKLFGQAWNARLEHVMRFCVLALLEVGGATVLSIIKLLTDRDYRQAIIKQLNDQTVKNFWTNEFAAWSEKFDSEAIMPILNKVAQFVSSPMIRNIVCQTNNKMNLADIMDNRKILLVKLSKGQLGESNANLIGAMMITRIYQVAMMRAEKREEDRVPFSVYIDEFQNFATDTFENILSEVRKYKLNITVAHQYMDQLSPSLRRTIFGNVANIISFRVGAEDAGILAKEYEPVFSVPDIMNLGVREMYLKMNVDGENTEAFSARTMNVPKLPYDYSQDIWNLSRKVYARPRKEVEEKIFGNDAETMKTMENLKVEGDFFQPVI